MQALASRSAAKVLAPEMHRRATRRLGRLAAKGPIRLHLGCGRDFKDSWVNVDHWALPWQEPKRLDAVSLDLARGIPMDGESCEEIYSSHLLEHLAQRVPRISVPP